MLRIGALYGIEEEIRGKPAEHRCSVRQARARPLLDSLRHWMEKALRSLSTKSETAAAIRYASMCATAPTGTEVVAGPVPDHGPDATSLFPGTASGAGQMK